MPRSANRVHGPGSVGRGLFPRRSDPCCHLFPIPVPALDGTCRCPVGQHVHCVCVHKRDVAARLFAQPWTPGGLSLGRCAQKCWCRRACTGTVATRHRDRRTSKTLTATWPTRQAGVRSWAVVIGSDTKRHWSAAVVHCRWPAPYALPTWFPR